MPTLPHTVSTPFYGHTVVRAAFVLAMFGWGVGFYGPPIFLQAVVARTGWPLPLVSAAVTVHFLFGAGVVACLPGIHRRLGLPAATVGGAVLLALGVAGWAVAAAPWQLFAAALCTGAGWVPLGAAGINAIVSPWFAEQRPMALAKAYNGASVGGMVFSPLWVLLMQQVGFAAASVLVGLAMVLVVLPIAGRTLRRTPVADGSHAGAGHGGAAAGTAVQRPHLWRDRAFATLALGMALGLFAQIGLLAQLFSLMVPAMGAQAAGWTMALATGCGMAGRLLMGRLLSGPQADRRRAASASYALQAAGTLLLWMGGAAHLWLVVLGVALFGLGIGNATSLPPLIAQAEFARAEVPRVVARCVAFAQALYAFAPAALSVLLVHGGGGAASPGTGTAAYFLAILLVQLLAALCMLGGRRPARAQS